jgi:hypothetical protein
MICTKSIRDYEFEFCFLLVFVNYATLHLKWKSFCFSQKIGAKNPTRMGMHKILLSKFPLKSSNMSKVIKQGQNWM